MIELAASAAATAATIVLAIRMFTGKSVSADLTVVVCAVVSLRAARDAVAGEPLIVTAAEVLFALYAAAYWATQPDESGP